MSDVNYFDKYDPPPQVAPQSAPSANYFDKYDDKKDAEKPVTGTVEAASSTPSGPSWLPRAIGDILKEIGKFGWRELFSNK